MARKVTVVPHTHWDREWYLPFQRFRLRLVELLDELLPRLDADPSFRHFLLDGQLAAVDDYLEIRPEAEAAIRRLNAAGRLATGPWYTLPDEFLVSGETLVRDLEMGLARAAELGGSMEIGYLPDMFGHIAQMPQLLRGFGFGHAVVWRGVPSAVDRTAFTWTAPDGSSVRAEYLPTGYGNGATVPTDPKTLLDQIASWEAEHAELLADAPLLWMAGTDHMVPPPHLPDVVARAAADARYEIGIGSLADHLAIAPPAGLPAWQGELRSGARANLLMGVTSNRLDVRRAAARAERALEQVAEPLCALHLPGDPVAQRLLAAAWRLLVLNAAHDSSCACSDDEVVASVLDRYAQARQIAEGLTDRALRVAAASAPGEGGVVVNLVPRRRGGVVEVLLPGSEVPEGAQLVKRLGGRRPLFDLPASSAATVLADIAHWTPNLSGVVVRAAGDEVEAELHADGRPGEAPDPPTIAAMVGALTAGRPGARVRAWIEQPTLVRVLVRVDEVGAWATAPLPATPTSAAPVVATGHLLDNGLLRVEVADDGTFAVDGHGGLGRLVEGGDAGDTYNWCPPRHDVVVAEPEQVVVGEATGGPVEATVEVRATYSWPASSDPLGRSAERVPVTVVTTIALRAGEPFVRVRHEWDNAVADHRLRVHLPLPAPAEGSRAECAFTVVERGLIAEGGPTEQPLATFPSRRFVQAGGLTVVHEGLNEYELVAIDGAGAHELALTLVRGTALLSQRPMDTRPLPAGPVQPLQGSQVRGHQAVAYAVALGPVDPYALVDDAFVPLVATGRAPAPPFATGSRAVPFSDLGTAQVSSLRDHDGALELRVFNPTSGPTVVEVARPGWLVDLRGRPLEPFEDRVHLAPHAIATLRS